VGHGGFRSTIIPRDITVNTRYSPGLHLTQLATKADIGELEVRLKELELRMTLKLGSLVIAGTAFLAVLKIFG
jgi:hypothetical protein